MVRAGWIVTTLTAAAAVAAAQEKAKGVSYKNDIEPIFQKSCWGCHNASDPKGGLNMDTWSLTQKGGKKGVCWEKGSKGKGKDSLLVQYLDGRLKPQMPKDRKPLTQAKIDLIIRWIDEGAINDGDDKPARPERYPGPKPLDYKVNPPVTALAWDKKNRWIAAADYRQIKLINPTTGKVDGHLFNVTQRIHALAFDAEGKILVAAGGVPGQLGEVTIYSTADMKVIGTLEDTKDVVYALAVRPDGKQIATGGPDKIIRIYDVEKRELLRKIDDHADWVCGLAYSPDGKKLASASRDKTVKFWDADKGERIQTGAGSGDTVYAVAWLPNNTAVLSAGGDKSVRIWNSADGKTSKNMGGHSGEVLCLALSADGKAAVTGAADKSVRVWNTGAGSALKTLTGMNDWVYAVCFSPDGNFVAAGSYDGEIRVWNVADGKQTAGWPASALPPPAPMKAEPKKAEPKKEDPKAKEKAKN
jgi:WD40 repeat protein